jgi:hypothetical protein
MVARDAMGAVKEDAQSEQVEQASVFQPHLVAHGLLFEAHHGSQRGPVVGVKAEH